MMRVSKMNVSTKTPLIFNRIFKKQLNTFYAQEHFAILKIATRK